LSRSGFLGNPRAVWSTVWRATLLVWIPQTAIWYVVASVYPGYTPHDIFMSPGMALMVGCVVGPYIETQMLRLVLHLLRRCLGDNPRVVWYSAAFWGAMHVPSSTWGLHAVWAFYIFTRCYLEQEKCSIRRAVWVTTAVHACCNLLSYLGTLLWRSME
jgi:hypothetical protein